MTGQQTGPTIKTFWRSLHFQFLRERMFFPVAATSNTSKKESQQQPNPHNKCHNNNRSKLHPTMETQTRHNKQQLSVTWEDSCLAWPLVSPNSSSAIHVRHTSELISFIRIRLLFVACVAVHHPKISFISRPNALLRLRLTPKIICLAVDLQVLEKHV